MRISKRNMYLQENQSKTFRLRDERQVRNYKRLDLIGKGPAAFYRDACRLISEEPLYESTVHIVAHLLREVESALRAVLLPYDFKQSDECSECGNKKEAHKKEITAILQSLGFGSDHNVSRLWLKLANRGDDFGLARKAHRDALAPPRRVDSEFHRMLSEIDTMLDAVLEKFEDRFLAAIPILDELLYRTTPSKNAAKRLKHEVPNNGILHGYFFERLSDPVWLDPLKAKGFFNHPPEPVHNLERGIITFPSWPESKYLARMAALDSPELKRKVLEVALKVETDNPTVYIDLTKAVLNMPPEMKIEWARKMAAWLGREVFIQPLLPEQLGNLAASLAEGGYKDIAIDLLRTLLTVQPDKREGSEGIEGFRENQPRPRFNLWHYAQIIKKNVPALVKGSGNDALKLLCDLLEEALMLSRLGDREDEGVRDYWRPSIDAGRNDRVLDALVSGVRDVAEQIARVDPAQVPEIIELLEGRQWRIFKRLSLHLLRSFPDAAPKLAVERLTNKKYFENYGLRGEYNALLKSRFPRLDEAEQVKILSWVEEGPQDLKSIKEGSESWYGRQITESDINEYVNKWKLERLDPIREALSGEWKEIYERLEKEYGRQEADEGSPYLARDVKGYISPKSPEELGVMGIDDIISYLESWQPSESPGGPSPLGLESTLRTTVITAPEPFSRGAEKFKNLRPEYIRALISGLSYALDQDQPIEWGPVLGLCRFIADEPIAFPADDDMSKKRDRLFAQLKKESSSLIRKGMRNDGSRIPDALSDDAFELIESLINKLPQVDTDQLTGKNRSTAEAIISARETSLEDIIWCASWIRTKRQQLSDDHTINEQALGKLAGLREILERNLDLNLDPDLRLRKIYGQYFPLLVYLDPAWAERHMLTIFPLGETERPLFDVAWKAYVLFGGYYDSTFELLQEQYRIAIERLGPVPASEMYTTDPNRQLAQHIMVSYAHGKSNLHEEESLISRFLTVASPSIRASALGFLGESLRGTEGSVNPEIISSLQTLWSKRFDHARHATTIDDYKDELAAFGWWFVSEKFDEEWSLTQLRKVLLLIKKVDADDYVVERMAALAFRYPRIVVECLSLMIEGDEEGYSVEIWKAPAQELLRAALKQETDSTAQHEASVLINHISARDAMDYALLLTELESTSH
jgi:hypothetical protein